MKLTYIAVCACMLIGCMRSNPEGQVKNDALEFLDAGAYRYSTSKLDIPSHVIDSISRRNKEPFTIGDSTDVGKINFSDVVGFEDHEYRRQLRYALINDAACMVIYAEGGIGTHDVVDYLKYGEGFQHIRYHAIKDLRDTNLLRAFLFSNPAQVP